MTEKQPKFCATGASASIDGTQAKNDTATGAKYGHPTLNPSQERFLSNAAKKYIASRHGQPGRGHQSFLIGGRGGRAEDTRQTRSVMTREAIDNHEDTYDRRNRAIDTISQWYMKVMGMISPLQAVTYATKAVRPNIIVGTDLSYREIFF